MIENPETGALENFNFDQLLQHVPELKRFNYRISSYQFDPPIDSSDMEPSLWANIIKIINYIYDDIRQLRLAPHKRMDLVVGDLRSDGRASVTLAANPQGVTLLDMGLPVKRITPATSDKDNFIAYLKSQIEALRPTMGRFSVMEMSRSTFNKNIVGRKAWI